MEYQYKEWEVPNVPLEKKAYIRSEMVENLKNFLKENEGNPVIINPFDEQGRYEDKDLLYAAYRENIALSYLKEETVKNVIDEMAMTIQKKLDTTEWMKPYRENLFKTSLLEGIYQVVQAKEHGLSEDQIRTGIRLALKEDVAHIEGEHLSSIYRGMEYGFSEELLKLSMEHPENLQMVEYYLEGCDYDEEAIKAILMGKDSGISYETYSAMYFGNDKGVLYPKEAVNAVQMANRIYDALKEKPGSFMRYFVDAAEAIMQDVTSLFQKYGDNLNQNQDIMNAICESYIKSPMNVALTSWVQSLSLDLKEDTSLRRMAGDGKEFAVFKEETDRDAVMMYAKEHDFTHMVICPLNFESKENFYVLYREGSRLPAYIENQVNMASEISLEEENDDHER